MVSEVDERVVQLTFDNKNFEKHAKESMSTLDKLKEKLGFKGVKEESKEVLNGILDGVRTLATKSETIWDRTIDKMKDSISTKLVSTLRSVTMEPLQSGWQKFGEKTRSVGTLIAQGYDLDTVNEQLEKLNVFTDETSYNFVDMVGNIAKFTASGQDLKDSVDAMMGIANWAALSGQNAQTASNAMYQLSQAMSKGVMKADDWKSISNASMATAEFKQKALEAAEAIGTVKKNADGTWQSLTGKKAQITISNFDSTLTENLWFTKDVMMEVYNTYASAFKDINDLVNGEEAVYDNFNDAIKGVKETNKELREDFLKTYGDEYQDNLEDILVAMSKVEDVTDEAAASLAKTYKLGNKFNKDELKKYSKYVSEFGIKAFQAGQEARTLGDAIDSIRDAVSSAFRNIYESIFGGYEKAKALWTDLANGLWSLFEPLFNLQYAFQEWSEKNFGGRDDLFRGIYAIAGGIQNIYEGMNSVIGTVLHTPAVDILTSISYKIKELGYEFYYFTYQLGENKVFEDLGKAFDNILSPIRYVYKTLKSTFVELFPKTRSLASVISDWSKRFEEFSKKFILTKDTMENIRNTIKGIWSGLNLVRKIVLSLWNGIISPFLDFVIGNLGTILSWLLKLTGTVGEWITELDKAVGLEEVAAKVSNVLGSALEFIKDTLITVATVLKNVLSPVLSWILKKITGLNEEIDNLFNSNDTGERSPLMAKFDSFMEKISKTYEGVESFKDIFDRFKTGHGFFNFVNLIGAVLDNLVQRLEVTVDAMIGSAEILSDNPAIQGIVSVFKSIWSGLKWIYHNLIVPVLRLLVEVVRATSLDVIKSLQEGDLIGAFEKINKVLTSGILFRLYKTLSGVRSILGGNGILGLIETISKTIKKFGKYIDARAMETRAKALMTMVKAIVVTFGLLVVIAQIPQEAMDDLWRAFGLFAALLAAVSAGLLVISGATAIAGDSLKGLALAFISLGVSMLMIFGSVVVVMNLMKNNVNIFYEALTVVQSMIYSITGTIALIAFIGQKSGTKPLEAMQGIGLIFLGIAAAILSFSIAAEKFQNVDFWTLIKTVVAIGGLFFALGKATSWIINGIKGTETAKSGLAAMLTIVGLAATMALIVVPMIKDLATDMSLDWGAMFASIGWLSIVLLAITGAFALMNVSTDSSAQKIAAALGFVAMAEVLDKIVVPMLKSLSEADWDMPVGKLVALGLAAVGIAGIFVVLGWAIRIATKNAKEMTKGKILALGAVLALFAATIALFIIPTADKLQDMDWANIGKFFVLMLTTFGSIFITLRTLGSMIKEVGSENANALALSIAGIAATLLVIGNILIPAIKGLGELGTGDWLGFAAAVLAPMITILYGLHQILSTGKADFKTTTAIVSGMAGIFLIIGAVMIPTMSLLKGEDFASILTMGLSIIGMIGILSYSIYQITSKGKPNWANLLITLTGMGFVFSIIGGLLIPSFKEIADINVEKVTTATLSVMGLMSVMMLMFNNLNDNAKVFKNGNRFDWTASWKKWVLSMGAMVVTMITLSLALKPIFAAFKQLETVDWRTILSAGVAISLIIGVLGAVAKFAGLDFLAVAGGIAVIAVAVAALVAALSQLYAVLYDAGVKSERAYEEGFTDEAGIESPSKEMKKNGHYLVEGLIRGIKKDAKKLNKYGELMADNIDDSFTSEMGIHSPSKVMYENGRYIVVGLANGMSSYESKKSLGNSAKTMGDIIGTSVGDAVSNSIKDNKLSVDWKGLFDEDTGLVGDVLNYINNGNIEWGSIGDGFLQKAAGAITEAVGLDPTSLEESGETVGEGILGGLTKMAKSKFDEYIRTNPNSLVAKVVGVVSGDESASDLAEAGAGWISNAFTSLTNNTQMINNVKSIGEVIGSAIITGVSNAVDAGIRSTPLLGWLYETAEGIVSSPSSETPTFIQKVLDQEKDYIKIGVGYYEFNNSRFAPSSKQASSIKKNIALNTELAESFRQLYWNSEEGFKSGKTQSQFMDTFINNAKFKLQVDSVEKIADGMLTFTADMNDALSKNLFKLDDDGFWVWADNLTEDQLKLQKYLKETWGIHSPSRWMIDFVKNIFLGGEKGVTRYSDYMSDAFSNTMELLKSDISDKFNGIDLLADPNYKVRTTFVPVVDMSGIQNGVSSLNNSLGWTGSVASQLSAAMSAPKDNGISSLESLITTKMNEAIAAVYASASKTTVDVNVTPDKDGIFNAVVEKTKEFRMKTGKMFSWS